jgi:hypothetical protein
MMIQLILMAVTVTLVLTLNALYLQYTTIKDLRESTQIYLAKTYEVEELLIHVLKKRCVNKPKLTLTKKEH